MKIAIEVNGVLRDTIKKIEQVYEKFYIDNVLNEQRDFVYEKLSEITSLKIQNHLKFKDDDEVYDFLYTEHCMEIFGHAPSTEYNTFNDLNEFYVDHRDNHEIFIISDEIGKSKPATLFFLSKFGCQIEKIYFYNQITLPKIWDEFDLLLTANPDLLLNHPSDKKIIKYNTIYNTQITNLPNIDNLKELKNFITDDTNLE
jgi:hypothetical protein